MSAAYRCAVCNKQTTADTQRHVRSREFTSSFPDKQVWVCLPCYREHVTDCQSCGHAVYTDTMHKTFSTSLVCYRCFLMHYVTCGDCEIAVSYFAAHRTRGDYSRCPDCYPYSENFPPGHFENQGGYDEVGSERCYGIELETDECLGYLALRGSAAWGAKDDCTVTGKEFYSTILSGNDGLEAVREWAELADKNNWEAGYDAGYHLHLDMRSESGERRYAIAFAFCKTEPVWLSFTDDHRQDGEYCHAMTWTCADLVRSVNRDMSFNIFASREERNNWCNIGAIQEHSTFEIRLHEGTCDSLAVINWVKACTRFADWAAEAGLEGVRDAFRDKSANELFDFIGREIWKDSELTDYYAKKAGKLDCSLEAVV